MKEISKHKIENAFDNYFFPLSDNDYDIHGMVPPERLHTFGSGICETLLDTMHDVVGVGNKNMMITRRVFLEVIVIYLCHNIGSNTSWGFNCWMTPPVLNSHAIQKGMKWYWKALLCRDAIKWFHLSFCGISLVTWWDSSISDANSNASHILQSHRSAMAHFPDYYLRLVVSLKVDVHSRHGKRCNKSCFLMFHKKLRLIIRLHCLYLGRTTGFSVLPMDYCPQARITI